MYTCRTLQLPWNPSSQATLFAPEKWSFKRSGLSLGVEIYTFMFRFTLSIGLSRAGGLSKGVLMFSDEINSLKEPVFLCPCCTIPCYSTLIKGSFSIKGLSVSITIEILGSFYTCTYKHNRHINI